MPLNTDSLFISMQSALALIVGAIKVFLIALALHAAQVSAGDTQALRAGSFGVVAHKLPSFSVCKTNADNDGNKTSGEN